MLPHRDTTILCKDDEIIMVRVWEIYLMYHPANLYGYLAKYSIDNGPLQDPKVPSRVIFRFRIADWEGVIKKLLADRRIPVVVPRTYGETKREKFRHPASALRTALHKNE